ncbi:YgaP family membrane protein [Desulfurella sp.]|uniref:YgaP family membrane protein n=1 Tax=Desulfurella sp. TaxID=1962857 RepID=UPI003D096074
MKKNVGGVDQKIRYSVGAGLIMYGIFKRKLMIIPGAMILGTAILQKCTLYDLIGINTYEKPKKLHD